MPKPDVRTGRRPRPLPAGVELYSFDADGLASRTTVEESAPVRWSGLHRFIDDGQWARYLIGAADTSPERPSNATYKMGIVAARSAFTPHAHRGEHFVLSLGYAACALPGPAPDDVTWLCVAPGMLVRIPAMMPHGFANRAGRPLLILAANTGYGIDHEDYAITAAEAARRAALPRPDGTDYPALAKQLSVLQGAPGPPPMSGRERVAALLRRAAAGQERRR